ncbi:MAG: GAF domain-containing protein [Spirochaetales bacterium]|nr:GAF domain-containing protein [Leptospiraceae bacterium]MCP5481313.1 GAF domain-containing protein [Spirochaetales bacterium]MCP5485749.1 GAF domain-containing protein [Spirochaetales bacterium]
MKASGEIRSSWTRPGDRARSAPLLLALAAVLSLVSPEFLRAQPSAIEPSIRISGVDTALLIAGRFPFATGDDPLYASLSYDDSEWDRIMVPALWQNAGIRHAGIGWYRIAFIVDDNLAGAGVDLSIMVPYVLAAHEVYVNGIKLGGRGRVDPDFERSRYNTTPVVVRIPAAVIRDGRNILAIRVRSYGQVGGIALPDFYIGGSAAVQDRLQRYLVWNSLLAGACLIVSLYFLTLYVAQRQDRSFMYFGLTALMSFFYALGSKSIDTYAHDFGNASFLIHETTIQTPLAFTPLFMMRFYQHFFGLRRRIPLELLAWACAGLGVMFYGSYVSRAVYDFHLLYLFPLIFVTGTAVFFYLVAANFRAVIRKAFGARTLMVGLLAFVGAIANDLLHHQLVFEGTTRLYEEGFTFFTAVMAVALGMKLSRTLAETDRLNRDLDAQVLERTQELHQAVLEAKEAGSEVQKLNDFTVKINETTDLNGIINYIAAHVREYFDIDGVMLYILHRPSREMRFFQVVGQEDRPVEQREFIQRLVFPLDQRGGMVAALIRKGRPLYMPRFRGVIDPHDPIVKLRAVAGVESAMAIPLVVQGEAIGLLFFTNFFRKMGLSRQSIASITRFGEQVAGAVYSSSLLRQVQLEREKSDELLLNILPAEVALELKETGAVQPLGYERVTVLFTDFVGFTKIAETMAPEDLIRELDGCFTQFDEIAARFGLEKLKTIGDAYMCAGGLPLANRTNAIDACLAALEFQAFMNQMKSIKGGLGLPFWSLRIGLHTGPVTAGVVGKNKFAYDIWGDTVNTASRLESTGSPDRINISAATYQLVRDFFRCEFRGPIEAKGKGQIDMYFLEGLLPHLARDQEARHPNDLFRERYKAVDQMR